eukprot:scaffold3438_cov243-Pinguiococcus_pyrenoidosus.AAC.5
MCAAETAIRVRDATNRCATFDISASFLAHRLNTGSFLFSRQKLQRFQEVCSVELPSKAAFRGAAVDPRGEFLCAFDNESRLHVWKIDYDLGDFSAEHVCKRHIKFDDADRERPVFGAWGPSGTLFASPGGATRSVHLYKRTDIEAASQDGGSKLLSVSDILSTDGAHGHKGDVVTVAWSPSGRYVASGCTGGVVVVWDAEGLEEVKIFESSSANEIINLRWVAKADSNAICLITGQGECAFLKEAVPSDRGLPLPSDASKQQSKRADDRSGDEPEAKKAQTKSSKRPGKKLRKSSASMKAKHHQARHKKQGKDATQPSLDDEDDGSGSEAEMAIEESESTQ